MERIKDSYEQYVNGEQQTNAKLMFENNAMSPLEYKMNKAKLTTGVPEWLKTKTSLWEASFDLTLNNFKRK